MADFSFVDPDAVLKRKDNGTSTNNAVGGTAQARISIPSFEDIQRSEKAAKAASFFRPSSSNPANTLRSPASFQQPRLGGASPLTFLDTGPRPRPTATAGSFLPRPPQQQQQHRPPLQGSAAGFQTGAAATRPLFPPSSSTGARPYISGSAAGPSAAPYPPAHPSHTPHPTQQAFQQQQQQQQRFPLPHAAWPAQPAYAPSQHAGPPPQQQQGGQQQHVHPNAIVVNRRQEGNPVLKHIRNVRWQFGDIVPDYMLGRDAAAIFISLRYHLLKPDYIHQRIRELQRSFRLRVVLCHVDTEDSVEPLAQVTRAAIGNDCTLICAWSNQECARYLETFKSYENKPAEVIQKDVGTDYVSRINAALTTIRGVNKTDVKTLGDRFGSVSAMFKASAEELQQCPGIGPTKARRLMETFHEPFRKNITAAAAARPPAQQAGHHQPPPSQQAQQSEQHVQQQPEALQQQQMEEEQQQQQHEEEEQQHVSSAQETARSGSQESGLSRGASGQVGSEGAEEVPAALGNSRRAGGGDEEFEYDIDEEDWDV